MEITQLLIEQVRKAYTARKQTVEEIAERFDLSIDDVEGILEDVLAAFDFASNRF